MNGIDKQKCAKNNKISWEADEYCKVCENWLML